MSRRVIQVPVTFDAANRRKDRSVSLRYSSTLELPNSEFAVMDQLVGSTGWLIYSENELTQEDVPKEDAAGDRKSPTERAYATLFVLWKKKYQGEYPDFEQFRRIRMESFISGIKAEIMEFER